MNTDYFVTDTLITSTYLVILYVIGYFSYFPYCLLVSLEFDNIKVFDKENDTLSK